MASRSGHGSLLALAWSLACGSPAATDEMRDGSSTTDAGGGSGSDGTAATSSDAGSSSDGAPAGTDESSDGDTGEPGMLVGSFQLQIDEPAVRDDGSTSLFGKIYDGASPQLLVWEPVASEGDCSLLTPRVPFCAVPCGTDAACIEDDTCQPYPTALDAGDITVQGVTTMAGETGFTMSPVAENYQPPAGTLLAYPGVDEGVAITLTAAGAAVEAFDLDAPGVASLVLDQDEVPLDPAADLELSWAPAVDPVASRVFAELDISHHGGTKGKITCEVDDDGALTISASLVSGLVDLGVAGFPSIVVRRHSTAWTNVAVGRIDLVVSSRVERSVVIAGLTSCDSDDDCPDAQTCQTDLTCN